MKKQTYFAQLLEEAGLSMAKFSSITGTPYRTVQDWKAGRRKTPRIAITFLKMYIKLKDFSMILCPACDGSFMLYNEDMNQEGYKITCPYCGAKKEDKDLLDDFIIQPAEWII